MDFATLDAHGHIDQKYSPPELEECGAILAMTISLDEAGRALDREDRSILWGVGCHPRSRRAQSGFDASRFEQLVRKTPVIGEIGLEIGTRVPVDLQVANFRQMLEILSAAPRLISIHAYHACTLVLDELRRRPVNVPVLHWWTGTAAQTIEAVEMGCYFSIHSAVARFSKFRKHVPIERVLLESDHGYNDPPAAIPVRIQWAEYLVAQQYEISVQELRAQVWRNLAEILRQTSTQYLLPEHSVYQILNEA
jgi:TatD DNase family protein